VERLGLYVHIPFCEARCGFCEYTVVDPATNASSEALYFDLLLKEFALYREAIQTPAKTLVGFDIGGGTPSAASTANIARVVQAAHRHFNLPEEVVISIETTPKIAAQHPEKIQAYYLMGIRRISMGVQSINPRLLEAVGRTGTSLGYNLAAVENIRAAGFKSFNIDVMYGFAHQTLGSVEATLKHVISLEPEHVTLYRTRYKGTRIAAQAEKVSLAEVTAQAESARQMLLAAGYAGTRGKNTFSRVPGDMGTSDYLTERVIHGTPYLGLGLGAQSLSHKTLSYNSGAADKRLDHYQRQVSYHLSRQAAMGKMISVSFYFGEINLSSFERKFEVSFEEAFPEEVAFVIGNDLMAYHPSPDRPQKLRLTARGERAINGVIALFYAGAVKAHLLKNV
jgi:oxygen-independent coproporphyrinogen-3 oxidase